MAAGSRSAPIFLALAFLTAFSKAAPGGPSLTISPAAEVLTKSVDQPFFMSCQPSGTNAALVNDIKWLDPSGREIESKGGRSEVTLYTEKRESDIESISLIFNSVKENQAGVYTCTAKYDNGAVLKKTVRLEAIVGIKWVDAPVNQNPIVGEDYLVKCKVHARPSPQIDWFFGTKPILTSNDHIIIEPNGLRISNVQPSDDGYYTCRAAVIDTGEFKERVIRVEVHERPKITEMDDRMLNVIDGQTASISCNATGKPPPKYTWIRKMDDTNLGLSGGRFSVNEITGEMTITNVNKDDTGVYFCKAKNDAGEDEKSTMINVIIKPKISELFNKTIALANTGNITCVATGNPAPEITFRKHTNSLSYEIGVQSDDDRITLSNNRSSERQETIGVLTITNVMRSDDGLYECVAKNSAGKAYRNGHIGVEFPPSFESMQNLTEVWTWNAQPVNITCIAESIPNATIEWETGTTRISDGFRNTRIIGKGPVSTIEVHPTDPRFYTNYRCIAANIHGRKEHSIKLSEAFAPGAIRSAKIKQITATTAIFDILLPVVQAGVPIKSVTVQYRENWQTWDHVRNRTWSVDPDGNNFFVVEYLKPETKYEFRFSAQNVVGFGPWSSSIEEFTRAKTVPAEPRFMTKNELDYETSRYSSQFEVRWNAPADNGEPIDFYELRYCQIRRVADRWETMEHTCTIRESKSTTNTVFWVRDLYADTFYIVEVRAHNLLGYSKPGYMRFKTARGVDSAVLNLQGPLMSNGAIVGIVVALIIVMLFIIDGICCCTHKTGIMFYVCERSRRKPVDEDDTKLGRDEKEPLKEEKKITPIIDSGLRRETSVTFDEKRSISKTGFVGKDSAV